MCVARSLGALTSNLHLRSNFASTSDSTKRNGSRSFCEHPRSSAISEAATTNNGQHQHRSDQSRLVCACTEHRLIAASVNYGFRNMNEPISSLANRDGE